MIWTGISAVTQIKFYQVILILKTETNNKGNKCGPLLSNNRGTLKEYKKLANDFNTHFLNIKDRRPSNNSTTTDPALNYLQDIFVRPFPSIQLAPVTVTEMKNIIKSLKWKDSHGYDEIPLKILKNKPTFYYFFSYIYM